MKLILKEFVQAKKLKRFKIKNFEDSSTKRIKIYKILNIVLDNLINAMKKSNIVEKSV